ncbi:GNAT family N-acetyltransferase [Ktedonospora formicarum]|uniref:GNAT family acetyltransferase n=1 Tax=Ktedonospora formicarum TaxID=2778364 RepID=A0A8J3MS53_9CHLR|nr:GNAT family N-acetyltransferase [Ktedonospora formicarum]GHO42980.1 GNAT family acetyltransferase [Ktedonospora formicarum]
MLIEGLSIRPATLDDAAQIAHIMNVCSLEFSGVPGISSAYLLFIWTRPTYKLAESVRVLVTAEDEIVGWVGLRHQQHIEVDFNMDVLPAYRGRVEQKLLCWARSRANEHITLAPEDMQVVLSTRANAKDSAHRVFLEHEGFQHIRSFWTMKRTLEGQPEQPQWAPSFQLRTFKELIEDPSQDDERISHAIFEAHEEAFADHWGHVPSTFEAWRERALNSRQDLGCFYLAMDGEQVAAYARCAEERGDGWVYTLGVRRAWRRKGLGLALLYHAFGEFYREGIRDIYLGVDAQSLTGATHLYKRAGMHVACEYTIYEQILRPGRDIRTQMLEQA